MNFEPLPDRYYLRDSALWNTLKHGRMVWFWLMAVLAVDLVLVGARSENSAENSFIALGLDRGGIAGWELWRLASYAPLHGGWLHRGLNLAMFVLLGSKVEWVKPADGGRPAMKEIQGEEFSLDTDLVLLAMGFLHVEHDAVVEGFKLELDSMGNIKVDKNYRTGFARAGPCLAQGAMETGSLTMVDTVT